MKYVVLALAVIGGLSVLRFLHAEWLSSRQGLIDAMRRTLGLCACHPEQQTGGGHHWTCPDFEPDCSCYEMFGTGHQAGCQAGAWLRAKADKEGE